jgi:hypothetical protein
MASAFGRGPDIRLERRSYLAAFPKRSICTICSFADGGVLAPLHPIPKRLIPFDFGDWSVFDLGSVLISAVNGHKLAAMCST